MHRIKVKFLVAFIVASVVIISLVGFDLTLSLENFDDALYLHPQEDLPPQEQPPPTPSRKGIWGRMIDISDFLCLHRFPSQLWLLKKTKFKIMQFEMIYKP